MEDLRIALRNLMQEMLLKKNLSSDEEFQHWWIDEGNERRYFALQGSLEELEEEERRRSLLSFSYLTEALEDLNGSSEEEGKKA
ncbi:hypothetical protein [Oribacterium asaccharolyticum]|uniref:hypothetical protein n=1 Tax=Oribacterium asaccharolyticum TaxID=1501332 RepID=UPI0028EFC352|nr:hypothetical protein [Oribacterium asaccharolyticum]